MPDIKALLKTYSEEYLKRLFFIVTQIQNTEGDDKKLWIAQLQKLIDAGENGQTQSEGNQDDS